MLHKKFCRLVSTKAPTSHTFRATMNLLFFSLARYTLPNFPLPRGRPMSKSSKDHFFLKDFHRINGTARMASLQSHIKCQYITSLTKIPATYFHTSQLIPVDACQYLECILQYIHNYTSKRMTKQVW